MDDVAKCSKSKKFSSKSNFYKDITIKAGLNRICKNCRRGNYNENIEKIKNYRKQYKKREKNQI